MPEVETSEAEIAASMAHWLNSDQPASYLAKFEDDQSKDPS